MHKAFEVLNKKCSGKENKGLARRPWTSCTFLLSNNFSSTAPPESICDVWFAIGYTEMKYNHKHHNQVSSIRKIYNKHKKQKQNYNMHFLQESLQMIKNKDQRIRKGIEKYNRPPRITMGPRQIHKLSRFLQFKPQL